MDPLDLTLEQQSSSYHETEMEIEHWCPVCDRLILPTPPPAGPAAAVDNKDKDKETTKSPISPITQTTTPTTPVHKRRSTAAARLGGRPALNRSRTSTTGAHNKKRSDLRTASNPNFLQDLINDFVAPSTPTHTSLSTRPHHRRGSGGVTPLTETAPRSKTSPIGNTSHHSDNDGEDLPSDLLRTTTGKAPVDGGGREGARTGVIKRKSSAPDVSAGGVPRLRPLTKSRLSGKPRPKSLNLVIAQELELQGDVSPKTSKTLVSSPVEQSALPMSGKEGLRRRLYCSEECYNVDLHGPNTFAEVRTSYRSPTATTATPPVQSYSPKFQDYPTTIRSSSTTLLDGSSSDTSRPFEVKSNLSCEMPWLWRSAAISARNASERRRRMAPTRNTSWLEADKEDNGNDEGLSHRRVVSVPLAPLAPFSLSHSRPGNRPAAPATTTPGPFPSNGIISHIDSASTLLPSGEPPLQKTHSTFEEEKSPHRLFFRRMPGKIDASPVVMPPLFVVDGQWTEAPPPGFDYVGFMAERERERRTRQIEITEAMLVKKSTDSSRKEKDVNAAATAEEIVALAGAGGAVDTVTKRHHDSAKRKKKADAERSQYERKMRTVHGPSGHFATDGPHHHHHHHHHKQQQPPWWHLDEREDWKAYWAARDSGEVEETVSWEMWQLRRHHERVARVEKEEALKRVEGERRRVQVDVAAATAASSSSSQKRTSEQVVGDRKKVAKRPFLIRVASQPTTSDVDLVADLYEEGEKRMNWIKEQQLQRATAAAAATAATVKERTPSRSSSSSDASPLGMNRTKALPAVLRHDNSTEAKSDSGAGTPSSFMRGNTLCIPGFVVEEKMAEKDPNASAVVAPDTPGFVFPLVAVPGSVDAAIRMVAGAARSPPSCRLPPGLALPASTLTGSVPTSTLGDPPGLCKPDGLSIPQLKKSNTLPIDPPSSQPTVPSDVPQGLSSRRRVQSLKNLTLTLPEYSGNNTVDENNRSSLVIPRSPLGLHSFSAAELPIVEARGRMATNAGRSGGASSVSRSSATRSKQGEGSSGSQRQLTLKPHVDLVTATAVMSPMYLPSSLRSQGLPTDLAISGSPEVVTAVSGVGSGSGSSGEESTWSRPEVRLDRNATIKVSSTMNLPRMQRGLAFTKIRPNAMGPMESNPEAIPAPTNAKDSEGPEAGSPLSYSASLLRCYSEFRSGSVPTGARAPPSPSATASTEKEYPVGKRRSLWGIFGSAKP